MKTHKLDAELITKYELTNERALFVEFAMGDE